MLPNWIKACHVTSIVPGLWEVLNKCYWLLLILGRSCTWSVDLGLARVLCCAQLCPTPCDPMDCSPPGSSSPWDFPGKDTGAGCQFSSPGDLLDLGTEPVSPPLKADSLLQSHWGNPNNVIAILLLWMRKLRNREIDTVFKITQLMELDSDTAICIDFTLFNLGFQTIYYLSPSNLHVSKGESMIHICVQ